MKYFEDVINAAIANGYSDIHIVGHQPTVYRKEGIIHFDKSPPWDAKELDNLVRGMLSTRQSLVLKKRWSVDLALTVNRTRLRINVFYTTRGLSLAIRLLPEVIPNIGSLNLHPSLQQIRDLKSGLILLCGSTGSGKSTTIAAILEELNRTRPVHIITLEDPIEYRFQGKMAFIEQREVGVHVPSFKQGLIDVLRENPDVIVVGELREPDTIRLTLSAAESGHLVFATLHATDAEDAVYRINSSAGGEGQEAIRHQFASTISWLIVQQFQRVERVGFRVPVLAIMKGTPSIRSLIRENKLNQIETAMHTGKNEGMFTSNRYLSEYLNSRETFMQPYKPTRGNEPDEQDYKSNLIDPNAIQDVVYMAMADEETKQATIKTTAVDGLETHHLVIDEDINLEDLIAQFDNYTPSKKAS